MYYQIKPKEIKCSKIPCQIVDTSSVITKLLRFVLNKGRKVLDCASSSPMLTTVRQCQVCIIDCTPPPNTHTHNVGQSHSVTAETVAGEGLYIHLSCTGNVTYFNSCMHLKLQTIQEQRLSQNKFKGNFVSLTCILQYFYNKCTVIVKTDITSLPSLILYHCIDDSLGTVTYPSPSW